MFDIMLVVIGVAGFAYVGYKDLKTTEFPDWVPYGMIAAAIMVRLVNSIVANDFTILTGSLINGLLLFGIGYILYLVGSWADGDAFILGALGFLFPLQTALFSPAYLLPLPLMLISNVFALGGVYMVVYAVVLGVKNGRVLGYLKKDMARNAGRLAIALLAIAIFAFGATYFMANSFGIRPDAALLSIPAGFVVYSVFLVLLWRYVKIIDRKIFVRRIHASKLRYGDIPVTMKQLRMPDPALIRKLRAKGGYVKIKEGVRFTPVFLIAFLFTLVYGDAIYWVLAAMAG
ncbi:MAG: prepilin peptidase [Candidatus Aenigmarchaeota archaeon]|nr:prepilin peptidase [Candidatus Aenigmarchaeota archaeon]